MSVEVCLQHHPHLHTAMTEGIYTALFDRPCPALLVSVMHDYRDHASYAYQFIKRLGGSPRVPDVCWERWEAARDAAVAEEGGDDVSGSGRDESLEVSMMSLGDEDLAHVLTGERDAGAGVGAGTGHQLNRPLVTRSGEWDLSASAASDEGLVGLRFQVFVYICLCLHRTHSGHCIRLCL